jgi:hypothetical protein
MEEPPGAHVPALEREVRSLSRDEITGIAEAVRLGAREGEHRWPPAERFWFDGTADTHLSSDEGGVLRELWTRMNAGLVYAVTAREVDAWIERPGLLAGLDRMGTSQRNRIEGAAATILERELGSEAWEGAIGIWNALCAALLADRLAPDLREDLMASWRRVRPPLEPRSPS